MIIDTVLFYLFIACIWWLYAFVYKDYMVDKTRQILFEIRDDLFDSAMEGKISFNDTAYGMTRNTLNGLIRFTHNFGLIRFFMLKHVWKNCDTTYRERFSSKFDHALGELTEEQKKIYKITLMRAHLSIMLHLMNTSVILSVIFWPLRFILFALNKIRHFKDQYNNNFANKDVFDSHVGISKDFWKTLDARANFIAHCK